MPIKRIRTASVPYNVSYLTANKIYFCNVSGVNLQTGTITADDGRAVSVYLSHCGHLNGEPWEVLPDEEPKK